MINVRQRHDVLKKNRLCSECLSKTHSIKDCKTSPCGISGCDKKHNLLLHEQKGNNRIDIQKRSTYSYRTSASSGLLLIVRLTLIDPDTSKSVDTYALQDTGSTVTLIDKSLKEMLNLSAKERELSEQTVQ